MRSRLRHSFLKQTSWVIVGGESGHNARPCQLNWIYRIVQSCKDAGVPVFVKQLGTVWAKEELGIYHLDSKGGNPEVWPENLKVREFPEEAIASSKEVQP